MLRDLLLVLPAAVLVAVQSAVAQPPAIPTAPPAAGARVATSPGVWTPVIGMRTRITSPALGPGRRVASVLAYRGDTLVVRPEGTRDSVTVALDQVTRLDVSLGRQRRIRKGLLVGFLSGAAVGVVLGYAAYGETTCEKNQLICPRRPFTRSEEALVSGAVVGLVGAAVGGVVGAIRRTERWERAPLGSRVGRLRLEPARRGGVALAVSF